MKGLYFLRGLFLVVSLSLSCCGGSSGFTVAGTLTKHGVSDGVVCYLKFVSYGGSGFDTPLYWTSSSPFWAGVAQYSYSGVKAGKYTGWAFIDVNGNASGKGDSVPDEGDWVTVDGADVDVQGDMILDIPDEFWTVFGQP